MTEENERNIDEEQHKKKEDSRSTEEKGGRMGLDQEEAQQIKKLTDKARKRVANKIRGH